jgi:hypothetical protein
MMLLKVLYDIQFGENRLKLKRTLDETTAASLERFFNLELLDADRVILMNVIETLKRNDLVISRDTDPETEEQWMLTNRGKRTAENNFTSGSWLRDGEYLLDSIGILGSAKIRTAPFNIRVTCGRCGTSRLTCKEDAEKSNDKIRPRPLRKTIRLVFIIPEHFELNKEGICLSSRRMLAIPVRLEKQIIDPGTRETRVFFRELISTNPLREEDAF